MQPECDARFPILRGFWLYCTLAEAATPLPRRSRFGQVIEPHSRLIYLAQASRHEAEVAVEQRDEAHAERLAESERARQVAEAELQENESRHAAELDRLRLEMGALEQAIKESEAARREVEAAVEPIAAENQAFSCWLESIPACTRNGS